jgi:hypothetical protein
MLLERLLIYIYFFHTVNKMNTKEVIEFWEDVKKVQNDEEWENVLAELDVCIDSHFSAFASY